LYQGKVRIVTRIAMHLWRGFDLTSDACVLHHCDVPTCFNPDHLWIGTTADNHADMMRKGRNVVLRGSQHGMAILTEADIPIVRARLAAGERCTDIARSYGVGPWVIREIKRGKNWKHVP
jgi:hypothetical protein